MECVLRDTSIGNAFVIHFLPHATKFCRFVDIGIIVTAARGDGEHDSGHHEDVSPKFHHFHLSVSIVTSI
jgi:hypothetical protein